MKNIKISRFIAAFTVACASILPSCSDFLDQMPKTALTEEQVFSDLKNVEPMVTGLYTSYRGVKEGRAGLTFLMLGLDESKQGVVQMTDANQAGLDLYNTALNSMSTQVDAMWTRRWPAVVSAAKAIYALDAFIEGATDETLLTTARILKGEACFMRAMVMLELTMYWGEVPVIDNATMVNTARQPLDVVWGQIFSDFKYASENLPEVQSDKKRATSGAALSMLGKAYMSVPAATGLRDFEKARECFATVISRGRYQLDTKYSNLFEESMEFTSPESVFELDFENPWPYQNYWEFDLGSRTVDAAFGNGCYFSGYDVALPTEYCYKMKDQGGIWETGDQRKNEAIRYDFTYMGITLTVPSWGSDELDPHIKKYEDERTDMMNGPYGNMWNSGKNFIVLRYADVLLCYAECLNELGQTNDAIGVVNQVRSRAWGGSLPADKQWSGLSQTDFRTQIMDERMRELCFEGWRRMDLIRTGNFVNLVKARNPWTKQSGTIQEYHNLWPIPDTEIKNNPDISEEDQNPGYN